VIVLDIETDRKASQIWCVCTCDENGKHIVWTTSEGLQQYVNDNAPVIMHNGIGFDAPVLRRVWGIVLKPSQVIDTLCMSRLYRPDIEGGHSLKAWGQRLRGDDGKIDFTDFDGGLCDEMVTYCKRDVDLTWELYRHLSDEMNKMGFSQQSIDLEHAIFVQMAKQERNGFLLDMRKATELLTELKNRMSVIEDELQETFPPIVTERWSEAKLVAEFF
jgi:DNA polymerase I-like protein with 3'-5' exonuclease and polymerase domains